MLCYAVLGVADLDRAEQEDYLVLLDSGAHEVLPQQVLQIV